MAAPVHVLLSCAVSVDGYLDDASPDRLLLSDEADFDRVDELRAGCDAVLVGAGTVRADDPRLEVRSPDRRKDRLDRGLPETPLKVTLTAGGALDPGARMFASGESVVYCAAPAAARLRRRLAGVAGAVTVVPTDPGSGLAPVLADLAGRGVGRLMVEGGGQVLTAFLTAGLADELYLAVAPLFVGDPAAPRAVGAGRFPHDVSRRMRLVDVRAVGDMAVLHYLLERADG
ncbi:MAG TPA: dihydrofolate reductase family protein [Acidimicrobiales bacterium]